MTNGTTEVTVGRATLDQAKNFLEELGITYNLPQLGAINYSDVPHQYTFAYKGERIVGILITTTRHNDFVSLTTVPDVDYNEVGGVLLTSLRVSQVLARSDDEKLIDLLECGGYRRTDYLVKYSLYRKVFPAGELLSIQ